MITTIVSIHVVPAIKHISMVAETNDVLKRIAARNGHKKNAKNAVLMNADKNNEQWMRLSIMLL